MSDKRPLYDNGVERHDVHTPEIVRAVYRSFGQAGSELITLDKYSQREFVHYFRALDKEHGETIALGLEAERKLRVATLEVENLRAKLNARSGTIPMVVLDLLCPLLQLVRTNVDEPLTREQQIDAFAEMVMRIQLATKVNALGKTDERDRHLKDALVSLVNLLVVPVARSIEAQADGQ